LTGEQLDFTNYVAKTGCWEDDTEVFISQEWEESLQGYQMYASANVELTGLVVYFIFNLENLFSSAHSHDEYPWQVLLRSVQQVWSLYHGM